ncbi:MAG: lipoprotein, partial [Mariniphaga sp.]|nr:lipoprotein [Mariniphaga sp.]
MKKYYIFLFVIIILLSACSTGKKALQKGNYFSAVSKSVQRLKSDPNNKNALTVLKDGYPLAINWSQEEMDQILSINQSFKWGRAVRLMEQVNKLSEEIRQSPAALNIIEEPKTYISELNMAREKAAEERYSAGIELLEMGTRESAREAFEHFYKTNNFIHGYRNVLEKINEAKALATVTVILEAMPVHTQKYKLTSEFFYDQVFEYLNNKFPNESFVNFYSPEQAEHAGLEYPD